MTSAVCDFIVSVIVLQVAIGLFGCVEGKQNGPEIIGVKDDIVIAANDNFSIYCEGDNPLKWTTPFVNNSHSTTFESRDELSLTRKYGKRLYISNMTYPYVGYYICSYENNSKKSSRVYLFVNDTEHLAVSDQETISLIVTQYQEAVIDCRPTSPDVKVTLSLLNDVEEIDFATYDPKTGFSFNVTDLSQNDHYLCNFNRDENTIDIFVFLIVVSPLDHLDLPLLTASNKNHTLVGERLEFVCEIEVPSSNIDMQIITPSGPFDTSNSTSRIEITSLEENIDGYVHKRKLKIHRTILSDRGTYSCHVSDSQGHTSSASLFVNVYDINENAAIKITEENDKYNLTVNAGEISVQWRLDIFGHPAPTLTWKDNKGQPIFMKNIKKYETNFTENEAFLKINNIVIEDFGKYTLTAKNGYQLYVLPLFLNVSDKPRVQISGDIFHLIDTVNNLKCKATGSPQPELFWETKQCKSEDMCQSTMIPNENVTTYDFIYAESTIELNATNKNYFVKCRGNNSLGFDEDIKDIFVTDVKNGLDVFNLPESAVYDIDNQYAIIAMGDETTITCGSCIATYDRPEWLFNNDLIYINNSHIQMSYTDYSQRTTLTITESNSSHSGLYSCRVRELTSKEFLYKNITLKIANPTTPVITNTTMDKGSLEIDYPNPVQMVCEYSGIPKPTITWLKDGKIFEPIDPRIQFSEDKGQVTFTKTDADIDEGTYKCLIENRMGNVFRETTLAFKNKNNQTYYLVLTGVLGLFILILVIWMIIKTRKERRMERQLRSLGLEHFKEGNIDSINPELGIDDQAELLPYNNKFEFPKEQLKLGKVLGSGAFGVVIKGEAKNIVDYEPLTLVAVKMVKKNADDMYFKALVSELKIMVHLGQHLNVVNLLGACTTNVFKKELFVIVEYCRYGNLQNYLLRHRGNFIDQFDRTTRRIDYNIGADLLERSLSVSSDASSPPTNMRDYRGATFSGGETTNNSDPNQGDETVILSNNSVQPDWRSNYKGDYKGNVQPICTKDLLAWSFQVARGMDYLASRKILHGDLAARNVLLADNNIVKICDFGLAKSMYKSDNYKKQGNGPLPLKWMAIEAIRDRIFSTQSDIWAFGIVLWEFFSLGRTPYPGMEANEQLFYKLVEGYRMECPDYAPDELYNIMTNCWEANPMRRLSFASLSEQIGKLLETGLRQHYIDLNDPYLAVNTQKLEEGEDYLAMLSPLTFEALSTPQPQQYVNDFVIPTDSLPTAESEGYMSMNSSIFSPRPSDLHNMFEFNVSNRKNKDSSEGHPHETLPMLSLGNQSLPTTPTDSFSNPSYHIPPNIREDASLKSTSDQIIASKDNYVTMPSHNNSKQNNENVNSDEIVPKISDKGNTYVNDFTRDWDSIQV